MWVPQYIYNYWSVISKGTQRNEFEAYSLLHSENLKLDLVIIFSVSDIRHNTHWLDLKVPSTEYALAIHSNGIEETVILGADTTRRLRTISFTGTCTSVIEEVWRCYNIASHLLSLWSISDGISGAIECVEVIDTATNVQLRSDPKYGIPAGTMPDVFAPPGLMLSPAHRAILSLYRECRNSTSPYYAVLCAFKIVESFYQNKLFKETDKQLSSIGNTTRRKRHTITPAFLKMTQTIGFDDELNGMKYRDYLEHVRELRNRIAHAILDDGDMMDLDTGNDRISATIATNILDLMARNLLFEELWLTYLIQENQAGRTTDREQIEFFREHRFVYVTGTSVTEPQKMWLTIK